MNIKYSINEKVYCVQVDPVQIKELTIGGILVDDQGTWLTDGVNMSIKYHEDNTFTTPEGAKEYATGIIVQKQQEELEKFVASLGDDV